MLTDHLCRELFGLGECSVVSVLVVAPILLLIVSTVMIVAGAMMLPKARAS